MAGFQSNPLEVVGQDTSAPPTMLQVRSQPSLPERSCRFIHNANAGRLDRNIQSSKIDVVGTAALGGSAFAQTSNPCIIDTHLRRNMWRPIWIAYSRTRTLSMAAYTSWTPQFALGHRLAGSTHTKKALTPDTEKQWSEVAKRYIERHVLEIWRGVDIT
jgi:hypothetical protein